MEFDGVDTSERLFEVGGDRPQEPTDAADALIENGFNGDDGPPTYLSPSSASTYRSCARRWKFRYVDRLPDPAGEAALAGTLAHRVLELLLQEDPNERTIERARTIARDVWPETADDPDFQALGLDDDAQRRFRWLAWTAIEGLWQLEDPAAVLVEATEARIDTMLGDVPFRGVVDRLDRLAADADSTSGAESSTRQPGTGALVVSDYKSGRAPSEQFAGGRLEQVLLYAAAVEASTGERPEHARLLYLGQRIIETPVTDELVERSVSDLSDTWEHMIADVDSEVYEPTPGPLCGWCPYADQCPEGLAELTNRRASGRIRESAPALRFLELAS